MSDYDTNKPIVIYTWKDKRLNQTYPKIIVKSMDNEGYNPDENAKQLARLFNMSIPNNTLEVLYTAMVDNILQILESGDIDILLQPYDLESRIRVGLNTLLED